jgi:hypothetical protein
MTTQTPWTPGPWKLMGKLDGELEAHEIDADGSYVGYAYKEADARLMTAAPDMAELLGEFAPADEPWDVDQDCKFCGGHYGEHSSECAWRRARALLSGIRGEA